MSFDEWLAAHPSGRPVTSDLTRTELRRTLQAVEVSEDDCHRAELWIRPHGTDQARPGAVRLGRAPHRRAQAAFTRCAPSRRRP
ncbi:hypothetical protein [Glycomyces tenuis]|uniref:hypothetical protein n=1 Tax=Glycomyces tenuis TaxID=58116 RepID=UPI003CCBFF7D